MEGLFSKYFKNPIETKTIPVPSFTRALRRRLSMICSDYCEELGSFEDSTDTEIEAFIALKKAYGRDTLRVQDEMTNESRDATGFDDFLLFAYPLFVLDAIEAFYRMLSDRNKHSFQIKINAVLTEEDSPWRLSDGRMYLIDSRFLDALKDEVEEEMRQEGFFGAYEEFKDARSNLQAGDVDDAIHKANCAFESALKSLLNQKEGTADDLLKKLRNKTDLLGTVSDEAQSAIASKLLHGLPILRHKIGGHGQGSEPVYVPRAYGDLAINLAAAYIKFLLDLKREFTLAPNTEKHYEVENDDVPFK